MEPQPKKVKITDHFRVALKPINNNNHKNLITKSKPEILGQLQQNQQFNEKQLPPPPTQVHDKRKSQQHQLLPQAQPPPPPPILIDKQKQQQLHDKLQQQVQEKVRPQQLTLHQLTKPLLQQKVKQPQPLPQPVPLPLPLTQEEELDLESELELELELLREDNHNQQHKEELPQQLHQHQEKAPKYTGPPGLSPELDYDATQLDNILSEPHYAWESYQYDKEREIKLRTSKYLDIPELNHQITPRLRARFIDWLILIQNDFRLDHEPLYMAVKLVDQYLMHKTVMKPHLELLFITSIFISVKFEYRPDYVTISELLHEFGDKYRKRQVINYEIDILSTLNFDIRFPLSYGFLRRFARCTNTSLKTLTLARYILESTLLEYDMIDILESKKAAASLLLANKMLFHEITWDKAAEFYTGYHEAELEPLVIKLNEIISRPFDRKLGAIKRKYTSEIFMSVANIAPLPI